MIPGESEQAFDNLIQAAFENEILDPRTAAVAGLASALALRCDICTERFLNKGQEAGLSDQEMGAIAAIAMCVGAGSVRNTARQALDDCSRGSKEDQ